MSEITYSNPTVLSYPYYPFEYKKEHLQHVAFAARLSAAHRYGIFAEEMVLPGEIIEECPLLLCDVSNGSDELMGACFAWDDDGNDYDKPNSGSKIALALGYGSMYSHSTTPNTTYVIDRDNKLLRIVANKLIYRGEEILIDRSIGKNCFANMAEIDAVGGTLKSESGEEYARKVRRVIILTCIFAIAYFFTPTTAKFRVPLAPAATSAPQASSSVR